MAFAVQSAHPSQVHSHSTEAADALVDVLVDATDQKKMLELDTVGYSFTDYWQRFDAVDKAVVTSVVETQPVLIPHGKTVKVL